MKPKAPASSPPLAPQQYTFQRLTPACTQGLTSAQVQQRIDAGAHNVQPTGLTPTVGRIIFKNTFTLFNLINLVLAVAILLVGQPKNALFLGIAICNTAMGIFQELRAKRTLDKLAIMAQTKAAVVRDGQLLQIDQDEVVLDDILYLKTGSQISADCVVLQAEGFEVDESLLTGEADNIRKQPGDAGMSGSFVVAGQAYALVQAVGHNNYATQLTVQAKQVKEAPSQLMRTLNGIIRVLTIVIIPLGALLMVTQYRSSGSLTTSVQGAAAAMIGMIPEGLVLLTGLTMTLGALRLARRKALVQSLSSIETLARVDVLCLDKTGTITDGSLSFEELLPQNGATQQECAAAIAALMTSLHDDNATAIALRAAFCGGQNALPPQTATALVPFSSARKWSGATFAQSGSFLIGAPAFIFPNLESQPFAQSIPHYTAAGHRVLCLAHSPNALGQDAALPQGLRCIGLVVISDSIREEAPDTFRFFENEGVTLKVISGDDALTASTIAQKAGIKNADKYIDLSGYGETTDFSYIVEQYTVFGRVTPQQKKALIAALKANGHTACMTGDGVNDVLAMKEASCSVAMIGGSDAARGASDFVLMTSDFSAMIEVLREGRKVINNIESVSCLYLVKTIYSTLLSLLYIFIPYPYPFETLQMTPINSLTVGLPSFLLALRGNYQKPEGRFVGNILQNSLPAALSVVFSILVIQLASIAFGLNHNQLSTMCVLITGAVGFVLLYQVSQPLSKRWIAMMVLLPLAFVACFVVLPGFFEFEGLFSRNVFFYLPLLYVAPRLYLFLRKVVAKAEAWVVKLRA